MTKQEQTTYITIDVAACQTSVSPRIVRHCIQIGLVDETMTEGDLAELRRVRRLTSLGVNLAGVEIILRMRRRIEELQAELARLGSEQSERLLRAHRRQKR